MCFSPEMDLVAGVVVTGIGLDALRHARRPEQLPLATLPLVFGVHQLVEVLVWLHLQDRGVSAGLAAFAVWTYLLIATVIVPVLVPWAFLRLDLLRSRVVGQVLLGAGLAAAVLDALALGVRDVPARINGHHVAYSIGLAAPAPTLALYVLATCAPPLLARSALLRLFGLGNLVVVATLVWLQQNAVISLWCVWAAATSVLIDLYLRRSGDQVRVDRRAASAASSV